MPNQIIHIHADAPAKPPAGSACNGCGVCCSWRPCPMGAMISGRLQGPCKALRWFDSARLYRCGMVDDPGAVLPRLPAWAAPALARLARLWIAQGAGCDSSLEARPAAVSG